MREETFTHEVYGTITCVSVYDAMAAVELKSQSLFPLKDGDMLGRVIFVNDHIRAIYHLWHIGGAVKEENPTWCNIPIKVDNTLANNTLTMKVVIRNGCGG